MKTIVSIKDIYYGDSIKTGTLDGAAVAAFINDSKVKKVNNVHDTTWAYEEAEASITDYVNQRNGKVYYRDATPGAVQISFSIGQYDYETKADLQGGEGTETSWTRKDYDLTYKCVVAVTKDDTYIVFPNASITARGGMVEDKVIGIMFAAVAMDTGVDTIPSEMWLDKSEVIPAE